MTDKATTMTLYLSRVMREELGQIAGRAGVSVSSLVSQVMEIVLAFCAREDPGLGKRQERADDDLAAKVELAGVMKELARRLRD